MIEIFAFEQTQSSLGVSMVELVKGLCGAVGKTDIIVRPYAIEVMTGNEPLLIIVTKLLCVLFFE